jgi:hypothetical protein
VQKGGHAASCRRNRPSPLSHGPVLKLVARAVVSHIKADLK